MPAESYLLAAIAFGGAVIFGVTGFGAALVGMPLATHLVPLEFALPLFALADIANSYSVGLEKPRNAVRGEYLRLVPMILVGTAAGVTVLVNLPRAAGQALLGAFVVAYALYALVPHEYARPISRNWAWLAGFCGGVTSALFGAGGPPYVIYLAQRALGKEEFRATLGLVTMTSISLRVIAFLLTGLLLDARVWLAAALVVPAALAGIWLGRRVYLGLPRALLMRAIALLLLLSGGSLLWRSLGCFSRAARCSGGRSTRKRRYRRGCFHQRASCSAIGFASAICGSECSCFASVSHCSTSFCARANASWNELAAGSASLK